MFACLPGWNLLVLSIMGGKDICLCSFMEGVWFMERKIWLFFNSMFDGHVVVYYLLLKGIDIRYLLHLPRAGRPACCLKRSSSHYLVAWSDQMSIHTYTSITQSIHLCFKYRNLYPNLLFLSS